MNKFLFGLFLSLTLVSFVFAQNQNEENTNSVGEDAVEYTSVEPDLYIDKLSLAQDNFKTGGFINGTFSIFNTGERVASNVQYKIELITIESGQQIIYPVSFLDSSDLSEIGNISNGESKVNFSYKIPNSLPEGEEFAISVSAFIDNKISAREDMRVKIEGNLINYISQTEAYLNIGEETFLLKEGPTISPEEKIQLTTELLASENVSGIVPNLKVFEGINIDGEVVYDVNLDTFSLPNGTKTEKSFDLPTSFKPGVYTALLNLTKDNETVSEMIEMRYIIGGDELKPKIGQIDFNNLDQNSIDSFIISLSYNDIPANHRLDSEGKFIDPRAEKFFVKNVENLTEDAIGKLNLVDNFSLPKTLSTELSIFDAKTGKVIYTENVSDLTSLTDFEFPVIKNTNEIKVVVNLKDNGEIIDTKEVSLNIVPKRGGWLFFDMLFSDPKFAGVAGFIVLVIIFAIMGIAAHFKKNKTLTSLSIVLVGCAVAGSLFVFNNTEKVSAGTVYVTDVEVFSPKPAAVRSYQPNELMEFKATADFTYCGNTWYASKGQISEPVLRGKPHRGFGPLTKADSLRQVAKGQQKKFISTYAQNFRAPDKPGNYWFKYRIIVENGQGTGKVKEGTANFKIQGEDLCLNIAGVQEDLPRGYLQSRNANGGKICVPQTANLKCFPSKGKLLPGESVTYTAQRQSGGNANFTWYEGGSASGTVLKTQNNTALSTYTTSYPNPGMYLVSVLVQGANGLAEKCSMGVAVGEDFWDQLDEEGEETTVEVVEDEYFVDENGNRYLLDRNAAPGKIEFKMPNNLTNNTCAANWTAENVLKCSLYRNNVKAKDIQFTGSEDLAPGTYQIRCNQTKDGAEIKSETKTCTLNPNIREM